MNARRAIVEVRWGKLAARTAVVEPGQALVVGRVGRGDRGPHRELCVPHDARMSAQHFELTWDGARCRLRDLGSAQGTSLQGEPVSEAEVQSGAWIRAGDTSLMVYFEAHTPPTATAPATVDAKLRALHQLQGTAHLFAVVDASRGARPLQLLREAVDAHRSLYDGVKGEVLASSAPYLVALRPDSGLLSRLVRESWGAGWAIYLSCARPFDQVRRHLRRFLVVEDDESGERYYFRFFDPKTLRVFLPTCSPRQRADFFGEVALYLAEGEQGELCRFTP
jgi:hypothetical protein